MLICVGSKPLITAVKASSTADNDINAIAVRLAQKLLPGELELAAARSAASKLAKSLRQNGTWPDIDYNDFRVAEWPMMRHLDRVVQMAAAWRGFNASAIVDDGPAQAALSNGTTRALKLWLLHDWKNPNWYDNEIAVPRAMGQIALLLSPNGHAMLSRAEGAEMVEIMARAQWKRYTGANRLDMLLIQIHRGAFTRNTTVLSQGFAESFASVTRHHQHEESIQHDNSFHQHGPQLLSGGYGAVFTNDILFVACISIGTAFQIPTAAASVFESFVLDGQAPMTRAGSFDWQVH